MQHAEEFPAELASAASAPLVRGFITSRHVDRLGVIQTVFVVAGAEKRVLAEVARRPETMLVTRPGVCRRIWRRSAGRSRSRRPRERRAVRRISFAEAERRFWLSILAEGLSSEDVAAGFSACSRSGTACSSGTARPFRSVSLFTMVVTVSAACDRRRLGARTAQVVGLGQTAATPLPALSWELLRHAALR